tara:strand:- start:1862 stop:2173 length:312 start_codon:yes stop_codon:yes gene_type:complete
MDTTKSKLLKLLDEKADNYRVLINLRKHYKDLEEKSYTTYQKDKLNDNRRRDINPIKYKLEEIELELNLLLKSYFSNNKDNKTYFSNNKDNKTYLPGEIWNPY